MRAFCLLLVLFMPFAACAHSEDYPVTAQGAADMRGLDTPLRDRIYSCDAMAMGVPAL